MCVSIKTLMRSVYTIMLSSMIICMISASAHAGVVFENYSLYETGGEFADLLSGESNAFDAFDEFPGFPAAGSDFQSISDTSNTVEASSGADLFIAVSGGSTGSTPAVLNSVLNTNAHAAATDRSQTAYAYSSAILEIVFNLDEDYLMLFESSLFSATGSGDLYYELTDNSSSVQIFGGDIFDGAVSVSESAALVAGSYSLYVEAFSEASAPGTGSGSTALVSDASSQADFFMELVPVSAVPLPAAVWLFGSGLLGLAGLARVSARRERVRQTCG